jgi:hypothetical protein
MPLSQLRVPEGLDANAAKLPLFPGIQRETNFQASQSGGTKASP